MLKQEFAELLAIFDLAAEGNLPNLQEVFGRSMQFFDHLKNTMQKGTQEEQREGIKMLTELYQHLLKEAEKISKRTGLSEDQLAAFAENPSNYTTEQWQHIQESRDQIRAMGGSLMKALEAAGKGGKSPVEEMPRSAKPTEKKKRTPERKDWKKT